MDVRPGAATDSPAIREIARASFQSSYALSPQQLTALVEHGFGGDAVADRVAAGDATVLVAEVDGRVVGFAEVTWGDEPALQWLHVHPDARGQGVATALVERAEAALASRGHPLTARVLESASEGGEFLERFGLGPVGHREVEVADERLHERVYAPGSPGREANRPVVAVPDAVALKGERRPVDDEPIPGTEAPFFAVYRDADRAASYGYFCSECGGTDVVADGLERLECTTCGNRHLADEWDDAYL